MRLMVLVLTAALLWPVSVFSETPDFSARSFVDGNALFRACSDGRDISAQGYCIGYVAGLMDAIFALNAMKENGLVIPSTCPPKEHIVPDQVRDIVMQQLTAHPEQRQNAAAFLAWRAIQAAFPCKEQAH